MSNQIPLVDTFVENWWRNCVLHPFKYLLVDTCGDWRQCWTALFWMVPKLKRWMFSLRFITIQLTYTNRQKKLYNLTINPVNPEFSSHSFPNNFVLLMLRLGSGAISCIWQQWNYVKIPLHVSYLICFWFLTLCQILNCNKKLINNFIFFPFTYLKLLICLDNISLFNATV